MSQTVTHSVKEYKSIQCSSLKAVLCAYNRQRGRRISWLECCCQYCAPTVQGTAFVGSQDPGKTLKAFSLASFRNVTNVPNAFCLLYLGHEYIFRASFQYGTGKASAKKNAECLDKLDFTASMSSYWDVFYKCSVL